MAGEPANHPRRDFDAKLIEKAARDPAFREELLRDPRGAVEREMSAASGGAVRLPAHVNVVVHEETPQNIHLVIPAKATHGGELGDSELARLAGGNWTPTGQSILNPSVCDPATCG